MEWSSIKEKASKCSSDQRIQTQQNKRKKDRNASFECLGKITSGLKFVFIYFGWEFYNHVIWESSPVPEGRWQQKLKEQFPTSPGARNPSRCDQFCSHLSGYAEHPAVFQSKPRCSRDCTIPTAYHKWGKQIFRRGGRNMGSQIWIPPRPALCTCLEFCWILFLLNFPKSQQRICLQRAPILQATGSTVCVTAVFFWKTK